ncbi:glycosyltransferase family 2 protein [Marilutibacter chinensis]|uniref:Glycosyltransferase family 2 protein n=1 Tax=Marilutibacter chinensis TaxID=2912247 RepID=A0ABS9HYZ9_9GAMM|nr:glycosyltransferase family 2 protein [Lysobacter chinensis]MCF7223781.1 glycosyltransferase family 2 protein [Lysobacter chinensis]
MRLILTLLCRNEADIVGSMLDFHLSRGVDLIIATDNGSSDGTDAVLETYERKGVLRLLRESSHTHDQAVWVTRMARMAAEEYGADWVINSDADEFWWPTGGNLKDELAAIPASVQALSVERRNFLPPGPNAADELPFHQKQTIRERRSLNSRGRPLPPKVCHRGLAAIAIGDGNHVVMLDGQAVPAAPSSGLDILHFPVRSYDQLERKIREGTEALIRNPRVSSRVGDTWRHLYSQHLLGGTLPAYYVGLRPPPTTLEEGLASGDLVDDRRLQKALAMRPPL